MWKLQFITCTYQKNPDKACIDENGMVVNEKGETLIESDISTSGHKNFGESTEKAVMRIPEERSDKASSHR